MIKRTAQVVRRVCLADHDHDTSGRSGKSRRRVAGAALSEGIRTVAAALHRVSLHHGRLPLLNRSQTAPRPLLLRFARSWRGRALRRFAGSCTRSCWRTRHRPPYGGRSAPSRRASRRWASRAACTPRLYRPLATPCPNSSHGRAAQARRIRRHLPPQSRRPIARRNVDLQAPMLVMAHPLDRPGGRDIYSRAVLGDAALAQLATKACAGLTITEERDARAAPRRHLRHLRSCGRVRRSRGCTCRCRRCSFVAPASAACGRARFDRVRRPYQRQLFIGADHACARGGGRAAAAGGRARRFRRRERARAIWTVSRQPTESS